MRLSRRELLNTIAAAALTTLAITHRFKGRAWPSPKDPLLTSAEQLDLDRYRNAARGPCGQSCARCGRQWYEHDEYETDTLTTQAISIAKERKFRV